MGSVPSHRNAVFADVCPDVRRVRLTHARVTGRMYNSLDIKYSCGMNDVWVLNLDSSSDTYLNW